MKNTVSRALIVCLCCLACNSFAGTGAEYSGATTQAAADETRGTFPFEFDAEYAYIGKSDVERSFRRNNDIDENYSLVRFVYTPRVKFGILRLGAEWERFDFGGLDPFVVQAGGMLPSFSVFHSQLPDTLQSVSAVVGLDTQFSDSILVRFEAQPGFYGTSDLDSDTFNVPIVLGGTYIYSPNLQFIFGVSIDYERNYPVLPGGGIRWRFASQWVLNAALPTPRLEFEATKNLTLYAGANIKSSTFRVPNDFDTRNVGGGLLVSTRGDTRLNNALLTYSEIRTGGGVEWKITSGTKLSLEGGYLPYREFDYHRADIRYKRDGGAPYGSVAFHAAF